MTNPREWDWEGITPGTALTTTNTVADDGTHATTSGINSGTTTIQASATHYKGAGSVEFVNAASSSSIQRLPFDSANVQQAVRFMHRIDRLPNVSLIFGVVRHASGNLFRLALTGGNKIQIQTAAGVGIVASTASYVAAQWNRIEMVFTIATSSTGVCTVNIYSGDSLTPYATATTSVGDLGTAAATHMEIGTPSAIGALTGGNLTQNFDAFKSNTGSAVEIGPIPASPPVVSLTARQNLAAASVATVHATATDDGTIVSYDWSVVSASSSASPSLDVAGSNVSFTVPAAGNLVTIQCVVTDDSGQATTATTEVASLLTSGTVSRTVSLNGTGDAWVNTGGAANDGAGLADESDTTYMLSSDVTGTEFKRRYRLQASLARSSAALKLKLWTESGTANSNIRLFEGVTSRQTWTQALTTTPTEYTFTLSGGTITAITDWGNLYFEVGVTT